MTDTRELLAEAFSEVHDKETLKASLRAITDITHEFGVTCPRCKHGFKTPFPHPEKQSKAFSDLLTQAKGAPKQTVEHVTPKHLDELLKLDDADLAALLGGET